MALRHTFGAPAMVVVWLCAAMSSAEAQQADLSTYVGAGDDFLGTSTPDQLSRDRWYVGFQGHATFEKRRARGTVTARVGGALRYFPDSRELLSLDRSASLGIDTQIGVSSRLRAAQTLQYSPYRQFGLSLLPADGVGALPIYNPEGAATYGQSFYDLGSLVEWSRRFSQRTELAVDYRFRVGLTAATAERPTSQRAGVGVRHTVGRYAALKFGTAYRFGRTAFHSSGLPTSALDFDVGVDYNRPLSFSRGTTITFSTGTAVVSRSPTGLEPGEVGRQIVAIGAVTARQTLGRRWDAQVGADRNLQYVEGFPDPFYATRVMTRLRGELGRRVSVLAGADYSTGGGIGPAVVSQQFSGFQAQARLNVRVSQRWHLFGAYHLTQNELSPESLRSLPPGTVLRPSQTSVQVGINVHVG